MCSMKTEYVFSVPCFSKLVLLCFGSLGVQGQIITSMTAVTQSIGRSEVSMLNEFKL